MHHAAALAKYETTKEMGDLAVIIDGYLRGYFTPRQFGVL